MASGRFDCTLSPAREAESRGREQGEGRKIPICRSPFHLCSPDDATVFGAMAQGAKHFYFWSYGPTYISTENYWSDLRSEYEGIAKLTSDLSRVERFLYPARVARDPVALLYSVSHDIWTPDDAAPFAEKRLLWHCLRHLGFQPTILSERDVVAGELDEHIALFVTDHCSAIWAIVTRGRTEETYNIGGDSERKNIDVVQGICEILDKTSPVSETPAAGCRESYSELIRFVTDRPGHDRRYAIDCGKIKSELGWKPGISFEEGLERTVHWYLKEITP